MTGLAGRGALAILLIGAAAAPSTAWATAKVTITVSDAAGVGFNDTTTAKPVGGNQGTTVGQQRLNVFQAAADAWGRILDSSVPIVVDASFAPLDCSNGMAVEGQAAPYSVQNIAGLPSKSAYPKALANKILGKETSPGEADITAQFNGALAQCIGTDWYYGLDGNASQTEADLLTTVMHELGHGLGFTDDVDPTTGAFSLGVATVFATYMLDSNTGKHFSEMTSSERKAAFTDVRKLVWDGPRTQAVAGHFLAKGAPSLQVTPTPSGFSGAIGEANFGSYLADIAAVSGGVAVGTMASSCTSVTGSLSGKIALVISPPSRCASINAAYDVQRAGATALLFAYDETGDPPPVALEFRNSDVASFPVTIPTLAVTIDDANAMQSASGLTASLSADNSKRVGADSNGYTFLFASNPIEAGSTGAHWDPLVRPNLIMEPVDQPNPVMYLDMEHAVLWDIGWTASCGNGTVEGQEACDDGASNSDYFPDACRLNCSKPSCGDGVVDTGEQCDPGGNGHVGDANCDSSCHLKSGVPSGTGGKGAGGAGGVVGAGGSTGKADAGSGVGGNPGQGGSTAGGSGGHSASGGSPGSGGQAGGSASQGGVAGASAGTGGAAGAGTGTSHGGASGSSAASQGGSAGSSTGTSQRGSSGCGCRVGGAGQHASASLLLGGLALTWLLRRRRPSA